MKRIFKVFVLLLPFVISCNSNRPDSDSKFNYLINIFSIQATAEAKLMEDGKIVESGITDEAGKIVFKDVEALTNLTVEICGGTVTLVSTAGPVAWSGCMNADFKVSDIKEMSVTVDIFSTFHSLYNSADSISEFQKYIDITTLPFPEFQTSLTDASKRYLWYQGFSKIAENVSDANGVTAETVYSTENLLNMLYADLADDNVINGSTDAAFGSLRVNASIMKDILANAIPQVSEMFKEADLEEWTDKIRNSTAKFLDGESIVDTEKPVIEIISPKGDNSLIYGDVTVEAIATDDNKIVNLSCEIIGDGMPDLTDTDKTNEKFSAIFDSTLITDGKITIKCVSGDGTNSSEAKKSAIISNNNTVKLKSFITNELTGWDSVAVYDFSGNKIKTLSFDEDEETTAFFAPGTYRFVFNGGTYKPVFLTDESIDFDSSLETRAEIKVGESATVIATPLTTLREYLYRAFENKDNNAAETKSFELISAHIDKDFPIYTEPVSKNQLTENSKYYIILAGLERLAVLIGERQKPALEAGSITIEQVLKALTCDLETDTKAVLDGGGTINKFSVDSYLFRYWYGIAVKLFLESNQNSTGLGFSDLQTVISNITTDTSELFPEDAKPKKITDQPPVILEKQFKRNFETNFQDYSVDNIIYANASVLSLKFKAFPDESGDLTIDSVGVSGDVEVQSLSDVNEDGIYEAEVKFPLADDGDKTILITAVDNAENTGTATLQALKDTVKPVITTFELSRNEKTITSEYVGLPFTFSYVIDELNYMDTQLAVKTSTDENPFSYSVINTVKSGSGQISASNLPGDKADGAYIFSVKFTDRAGNEETTQFQKIIDTASPAIDSIVMTPEINENGFVNSRNITIEITASDNIDQTLNYWKRRNSASFNQNTNDPVNIFNVEEPADAEISYWFKVSDQAGNESAESEPFVFTIDTINPVITILNKETLEAKPWESSADGLVLDYTIDELNRDFCELRINDTKTDDVTDFPSGSITFTSNSLLDPTIGPSLPNTVSIYCKDKAGNESVETVNVYIDDEAPTVSIDPANFKYNGSTVDPRIAPWTGLNIPVAISDNYGVSKDNLTVKYYYTAQITSMIGSNTSHRYPGSGWNEITNWTEGAVDDARCLSSDSCEIPAPHPSDSVLSDDAFFNMMNRTTAFILFAEVSDYAGNKSTTSIDWMDDLEPVLMKYGDLYYSSGKIYLSFVSEKTICSFSMKVDDESITPSCDHFYIDGKNWHVYSCPFDANSGASYQVTVSSVDYYGNSTLLNCSDFNSGNSNYCFSGTVKASDPQLSVTVTSQTNVSLSYEIASDSVITGCQILKSGTYFATCNGGLATGSKTENISTWDEGTYTIKVDAKNGVGVTASRTVNFYIDNTPTSFSLDIVNYKNVYYKESPTLKVSATIAGGVKNLKVFLPERYIHKSRNTDFTICAGQRCYKTYDKKIYDSEPACTTPLGGTRTCVFWHYTPPANIDSGYYKRVKWVIESNINGQSESGYFDLDGIDKVIRIANSEDDYTQIKNVEIDSDNKEMIVDFIPSIFSEASASSKAEFSYNFFNNPDVTDDSYYDRICYNPEYADFQKQYSFYKTKIKAVFDRLDFSVSDSGLSGVYKAYFKPNLNAYRFGNRTTYYVTCTDSKNCPISEAYYKVSSECFSYTDDDEHIVDHRCLPNADKHYTTEDVSIEDLDICKTYVYGGCGEFYKTCFVYDEPWIYTSYYKNMHEFQKRCPILRDFWYFPKDLKISITDDLGKTATVTNTSPGNYTPNTECPQQKRINEF